MVKAYKKNLNHNFTSETAHPPLIPLVIKYLKSNIPKVEHETINPIFPILYATD